MSEIKDVSKDNTAVHIEATFPQFTPQQLFDQLTQPKLLTQWWPQEAETDIQEGGTYALSWPAMNWTLRGEYTAVDRPARLAFTWNWDHQPELPERKVDITINAKEHGSSLSLQHGTYTDSAVDQEDRQSHIDGWLHFLKVLSDL